MSKVIQSLFLFCNFFFLNNNKSDESFNLRKAVEMDSSPQIDPFTYKKNVRLGLKKIEFAKMWT